jgi:Ion channel
MITHYFAHKKFLVLSCSLVLSLLLAPYFYTSEYAESISNGASLLVFCALLFDLRNEGKILRYTLVLVALEIFIHCSYIYFYTPMLYKIDSFSTIVFIFFMCVFIFNVMFKDIKFSLNTIYAGVSIYILLGAMFGCIYDFIYSLDSDAFVSLHYQLPEISELPRLSFIYFSISIITTVGYSTILPVTLFSQAFVSVEKLAGVLYLAIFISRLVTGLSIRYHSLQSRQNRAMEKTLKP